MTTKSAVGNVTAYNGKYLAKRARTILREKYGVGTKFESFEVHVHHEGGVVLVARGKNGGYEIQASEAI